MASNNSRLIKGLCFPITFESNDNGNYKPKLSGTEDVLRTSINNILMFPLNKRPNNPNFGTGLHQLIKEPNDLVLEALLKKQVIDKVIQLEDRCTIDLVEYSRTNDGNIKVNITFINPLNK